MDEGTGAPVRRGWGVVEALGVALVVAAVAVLVVTAARRWGDHIVGDADHHGATIWRVPGGYAILAMLVLGPGLSLAVGLGRPGRWPAALVAAVGGAVTGYVAVGQVARVQGSPPEGGDLHAWNLPGDGPVAIVAAMVLVVAWLLLAVAAFATRRDARRIAPAWRWWGTVAAVVGLAVFAAAGVVTARWYGTHRGIDRTTARPVGGHAAPATRDFGRPAWSGALPEYPIVVDRFLVTGGGSGISVRDVATGSERWHYHRQVWPSSGPELGISADRRTVVALWYRFDDAVLLAGFDLATGVLRWTRAVGDVETRSGTSVVDALTQIGDVVIIAMSGRSVVTGINVRTGYSWRWRPDVDCRSVRFAAAPDVLAVAVECSPEPTATRPQISTEPPAGKVVGLAVADGGERWSWRSPSPLAANSATLVSGADMAMVGDTLRVRTREHGDIPLDPATGTVRHPDVARHAAPTAGAMHTTLRAREATVYLGDTRAVGNVTAVDEAGGIRWARTVPELTGRFVSSSAAAGDLGYILLIPADARGSFSPLAVLRTQWLVVMDLSTGTVLANQQVVFPDDCACVSMSDPPGVALHPADGALLMTYGVTGTRGSVRALGYA